MFRSATFKLTLWYLALTMAISLMFSTVVYRLAASDINHGIRLQSERIYNQFPVFRNNPILSPDKDIDDGVHGLLIRLFLFNIVVLAIAGLASYYLAKITLQPIEEAHEQQKRFTADVSHELRTPLTALKMESEVALLTENASKTDLRGTISSNLEEVTKIERLINNLLRLTRLEHTELRQNFTTVNAKEIVENAIEQVSAQAETRDIKIETKLKNITFSGDPQSITQMLVIFLDNSIKYSHPKTTIDLTAKKNDQGVIFTVADHGLGIKKDDLDHIFDRFYRASSSRTKTDDNDGHGLGLSIAKTIADIHGANITVSSKLGSGTSVEVVFPKE